MIINKSKEAQAMSLLQDERDTYQQQVRALQELLRDNADELQKFRKLMSAGGGSGGKEDDAKKAAELQEKIVKLRAAVKDGEKALAEAEAAESAARAASAAVSQAPAEGEAGTDVAVVAAAPATTPDSAAGSATVEALRVSLAAVRAELSAVEEAAEAGASDAVKATRARERLERESREKLEALQKALETKVREGAALQEQLSTLEAAHSHDLETFLGKLNAREEEVAALQRDLKSAGEAAEALKSQLEEGRRKADEETRRAVAVAVEKAKKEGSGKAVDEAVANELKMKLDAAQAAVKQLTESSAEHHRAKDAAEAETKQVRERLIKREQRLAATVQERAEAQSAVTDLSEQLTALRKKVDKQRKEAKANEEGLRMTRAELERAYAGEEGGGTDRSFFFFFFFFRGERARPRFCGADCPRAPPAVCPLYPLPSTRRHC